MSNQIGNLSKSEKILLFLYEIGGGKIRKVKYEDIVVGVFKKYPGDFNLKGYAEYPDSGDLVHKPLYDFKKKGYVNAESKVFSLTERGIELVEQFRNRGQIEKNTKTERVSRSAETEFSRVKALEGFELFTDGKSDSISDNDFYNYLGVTVRTQKNAFMGRLNSMEAAVSEYEKKNDINMAPQFVLFHKFMTGRYKNIIDYFTQR